MPARTRRGRSIEFSVTSLKMLLPVSFYGGYFGAGVGVPILGVMSVATHGDYRSANVAKNLVTIVIGGLAGGTLARIAPREVMRVAVIAVGALLTVFFAWRYWF